MAQSGSKSGPKFWRNINIYLVPMNFGHLKPYLPTFTLISREKPRGTCYARAFMWGTGICAHAVMLSWWPANTVPVAWQLACNGPTNRLSGRGCLAIHRTLFAVPVQPCTGCSMVATGISGFNQRQLLQALFSRFAMYRRSIVRPGREHVRELLQDRPQRAAGRRAYRRS